MARLAGPIKDAIVNVLQSLIDSQVIKSIINDDLTPNPLTMDFPSFPCVVVGMPSQTSAYEENTSNMRTYEYPLLIVTRPEDYQKNRKGFEDMMDDISDAFDNQPTLKGAAEGGVMPTFTRPAPINTGDKTFIVTFAIISAKAYVPLNFN